MPSKLQHIFLLQTIKCSGAMRWPTRPTSLATSNSVGPDWIANYFWPICWDATRAAYIVIGPEKGVRATCGPYLLLRKWNCEFLLHRSARRLDWKPVGGGDIHRPRRRRLASAAAIFHLLLSLQLQHALPLLSGCLNSTLQGFKVWGTLSMNIMCFSLKDATSSQWSIPLLKFTCGISEWKFTHVVWNHISGIQATHQIPTILR